MAMSRGKGKDSRQRPVVPSKQPRSFAGKTKPGARKSPTVQKVKKPPRRVRSGSKFNQSSDSRLVHSY